MLLVFFATVPGIENMAGPKRDEVNIFVLTLEERKIKLLGSYISLWYSVEIQGKLE